MNRALSIFFILLASCTPEKQEAGVAEKVVVEDTARDTQVQDATIETTNTGNEAESAAVEDDCVFNNDYRTLTTEWLNESNIESFQWNDSAKHAIILIANDTILASRGGCIHLGIEIELRRGSNEHAVTDSAYWMNESLKLSEKFGFDFYAAEIRAGNVRRVINENGVVWYEFDDNDPDDNLYYNGIEIAWRNNSITLSMSQYYN